MEQCLKHKEKLIIERNHNIEIKPHNLVTFIHVLFIIILLFIFFFTSFLSLIMSQDTPLSPLNFPHLSSHKVMLIVSLPFVVINRCLNRTKLGKHHIHCVSTFGRLRNLWHGWLKINFVNESTFTIRNYSVFCRKEFPTTNVESESPTLDSWLGLLRFFTCLTNLVLPFCTS